MKYMSLLYLYPLRSCFFFYKLISDIVLLGYILQTGSDRAPLQVISHNDLWMKDISDQGKQESSVKKKITAQLLSNSFHSLISKGFVKETVHLCIFCRWETPRRSRITPQNRSESELSCGSQISWLVSYNAIFQNYYYLTEVYMVIFGGIFFFPEWVL